MAIVAVVSVTQSLALTQGSKNLFLDIGGPRCKEHVDELCENGLHSCLIFRDVGRLKEVHKRCRCCLTDACDRVIEETLADVKHRIAKVTLQYAFQVCAQSANAKEKAVADARVRVLGSGSDKPEGQSLCNVRNSL